MLGVCFWCADATVVGIPAIRAWAKPTCLQTKGIAIFLFTLARFIWHLVIIAIWKRDRTSYRLARGTYPLHRTRICTCAMPLYTVFHKGGKVNAKKQQFVQAAQVVATQLAQVLGKMRDLTETYFDRGYAAGAADPITDEDLSGLSIGVTAAQVVEFGQHGRQPHKVPERPGSRHRRLHAGNQQHSDRSIGETHEGKTR